jgi:phenylacetate-CoA ligase
VSDNRDGSNKASPKTPNQTVPTRAAKRTRRVAGATRRSGVSEIVWPKIPSGRAAVILAMQQQFNRTQWWTSERLLEAQLEQARLLIRHAARTVPFHRDRLSALRDLRSGELTLERFRTIPLMTRTEIQAAGKDLVTFKLPAGHGPARAARTSGSSGRPIHFQSTAVTALLVAALTMRGHLWHNRDLSLTNARIRATARTGKKSVWAPVPWSGQTVHLSGRLAMADLFDHIFRLDPAYFEAHPHQLLGLLQVSEETGVRPKSLREARTFGETLDPGIREKCLDLWGVPVTDVYSTEEFGTIAHQCPVATNLHVMAENVLVEVLDGDGYPCQPGETGQVVVTSLNNFATPFIRAELGDMAVAAAPCACGRGLPVIERIIGRERNLFVRPDGQRVFPEFYREMTALPPVRQFQLTQKSVALVEVKLAVTRALTAAEEDTVRGFLADGFGHAFDLDFVYVDEIPREPNGKYQDYRSEVTASQA